MVAFIVPSPAMCRRANGVGSGRAPGARHWLVHSPLLFVGILTSLQTLTGIWLLIVHGPGAGFGSTFLQTIFVFGFWGFSAVSENPSIVVFL